MRSKVSIQKPNFQTTPEVFSTHLFNSEPISQSFVGASGTITDTSARLSSLSVRKLARLYDRSGEAIQRQIFQEIRRREPYFDFSYLGHFLQAYCETKTAL